MGTCGYSKQGAIVHFIKVLSHSKESPEFSNCQRLNLRLECQFCLVNMLLLANYHSYEPRIPHV